MLRTLTVTLAVILGSQTALAADWTIRQTASIAATQVTLSQTNTATSQQAINAARVGNGNIASATQTVTLSGSGEFKLTQDGAQTTGNIQAANLATAADITDLTQSVTKTNGATTLEQNITSGGDNHQAINYASATGTINNAAQSFTGVDLTVQKSATTPANNIQTINHIEAPTHTGTITQTVTVDSLTHLNRPAEQDEIRINSIRGNASTATVQQTVTVAGELRVDPTTDTTVILNYQDQTQP